MTSTEVVRHHVTTSRAEQGLTFINMALQKLKTKTKYDITSADREIIIKIQSAIEAAKSKKDERDPCNQNNLFSSISVIIKDFRPLRKKTSNIIPYLKQIETKIDKDGCSMALITLHHEMHVPSLQEKIPWAPPNKSSITYLTNALDELINLPDAPFDRKNVAKLRVDMHEAKRMYIGSKTMLWDALNKDLDHRLGKSLNVDVGTMTYEKLVTILSDGGAAVMHKTSDRFFTENGITRRYVGTRHPTKRELEAQTDYNNMYSDFDQYYGGYNGIDHIDGGYNDIYYVGDGYNNIDYDINSNDNYHTFDMEIFIALTILFAMCIIYGMCCFLFTVSSAFIWNARKHENDPQDQSMDDVIEI